MPGPLVTSGWPAMPHLAAVGWLLRLLSSGSLPPSLMDRRLCAWLKAAEAPAYSPSPATNHSHVHDAAFPSMYMTLLFPSLPHGQGLYCIWGELVVCAKCCPSGRMCKPLGRTKQVQYSMPLSTLIRFPVCQDSWG